MDTINSKYEAPTPEIIAAINTIIAMIHEDGISGSPLYTYGILEIYKLKYDSLIDDDTDAWDKSIEDTLMLLADIAIVQ